MSELARRYAQALWQVSPDREALGRRPGPDGGARPLGRRSAPPAVRPEKEGGYWPGCPGWKRAAHCPHFYRLLAEKGRMALLSEIVEAFHGWSWPGGGGTRCMLTCVRPLEAGSWRRLRAAPPSHHKKGSSLTLRTDPALLGGLHWISRRAL